MIVNATRRNVQIVFFSVLFLSCLLPAVWYEMYYLIAVPFGVLFFWAGWQNIGVILFLLLFTLPFSTEWQFNADLGTDLPDELLMLLTAGLFVCYWFYSPQLLPRKIIRHPLIVLLTVTIAWTVVTILSSDYLLISVKFLLAKCWYIGAFVLAPLIVFSE